MVALKKYDRIEANALWRPEMGAQKREVIVALGDATLTIRALNDQALTHWSLAALERANPGQRPAIFHPDGDPGEELELPEAEGEMIDAIETLRRRVERARPRPGRLRLFGLSLSVAAVAYAAVFWLPAALRDHTLSVVPAVNRAEIGQALMTRMQRVTGPACGTDRSFSPLARLATRLASPKLAVMRGTVPDALHLPGGTILLSRNLVEDFEEPDVVAGYVLAERVRASSSDPLEPLLEYAGLVATFRLLTTGRVMPETLDGYAEHLLTDTRAEPETTRLLDAFAQAQVRSTPYAYARDLTGETVLALIEGDPMNGKPPEALLADGDWLRLQAVCDG